MAEYNVCMEAFERISADAGSQSRKFVSPRFQMLADKILESRLH